METSKIAAQLSAFVESLPPFIFHPNTLCHSPNPYTRGGTIRKTIIHTTEPCATGVERRHDQTHLHLVHHLALPLSLLSILPESLFHTAVERTSGVRD
ncbi:hypothetical protein HNY73_007678 [Argiope bruennichi]|uniref:Uncharacterized protein n=1 Tax=Argiope bruennichi TaxID=94029 RepID=A0A8T0FHA2_ARGBR|nr:hypothetical protein HNY73_007678 [Argiope bruennichi]